MDTNIRDEHLPLVGTKDLPKIETDLPLPSEGVKDLPRPRRGESTPFTARSSRDVDLLVAYV